MLLRRAARLRRLRNERNAWRRKAFQLIRGTIEASAKSASNRWLVVINREQEPALYWFDDELDARGFFDRASTQWTESFLTKIVIGPYGLV